MASTPDKTIDWEGMKPHYEAGIRSLRDLAEEYGCTAPAILKHAAKQKPPWVRDLKGRIQARADAKVNEAAVNARVNAPMTKARQAAVIETNATLQAGIRLGHRADIAKARGLTNELFGELERASKVRPGTKGRIELGQRAKIAKDLTEAMRVQIGLERQAFGIEAGDGGGSDDNEFSERLLNARKRAAGR